MTTIDERIVSMVFENAKFEAGAAKTMATLTKLDDGLKKIGQNNAAAGLDSIEKSANKVTLQGPLNALDKLRGRLFNSGKGATEGMSQIESAGNKVQLEQPVRALDKVQSKAANVGAGAAQSFSEIESASGKVSLQGLSAAMDAVTGKFSVLQGAASVAMGNITSQAAMKGGAFAKSFAIGPLQQGFSEYQTNLGSIQTILANTEGQKVSGLDNVNKSLGELNTYSDQTIYNFSEMAKNIGTFTAAGVDLPRATSSIKGIANLAALSGSNSQQASTAMYQLSQAISAGRVGLQDWNSVVNAGMGGAVFQKSLMRTAENMGALEKGAVKIDKATGKATVNGESFRNSIMAKPGEESWLSSDVLTKTLEQMTGDMSDAELKAQGFSAAQIDAIQKQAKNAKDAATQVKTLPQVWDVARETIGSGWAQTSQIIFGNFKESKKTFTELSNAVNGFINKMSTARNNLLKGWKDLGGRKALIEGLKNAFHALGNIIQPIHQAFRDIFPPQTAKGLFKLTQGFQRLMANLAANKSTMENIRSTFRGLFALLHIGMAIVKGVVRLVADLMSEFGGGAPGGILEFTGGVGEFLTSLDKMLIKGGALDRFFLKLTETLRKPVSVLHNLAVAIGDLFGGFNAGHSKLVTDSLGRTKIAISPLDKAIMHLNGTWDRFKDVLGKVAQFVKPLLDKVKEGFSGLSGVISEAFETKNFNKILGVLQTGFIAAIFLVLKKAITGGATEFSSAMGGVNKVLGGLSDHLKAMQQNVKANIILKIAGAIAILAAAVKLMSTIEPKRLTSAMAAVTLGLGELMGAMKLMTAGLGMTKAIAMIPVLATSLILMATSLTILAAAMKIFATMSWEDIAKGLVGVGGGLAAIGIGMKLVGPGAIAYAPGILLLSVALNLLATAVKIFSTMKWDELGRGLAGVFGVLAAMAVPMAAFGPEMVVVGPSLIAAAIGINLLAGAVLAMGKMDLKTIGRGIFGIGLSLLTIAGAVSLIPPTLALQAAGLVILAVALSGIAAAMKVFGSFSLEEMIKGLIGMGGALLVLAGGLTLMTGTLPGAIALMAAAAALALLAPTMAFMGNLKWGTIFKGLVAMALAMGVLAAAGMLAGPGIAALGTALLPLAGVLVLSAAAVMLFAKALQLMGGAGTKGIGVMVAAITAFVALIPKILIDFVKGLLDVLDVLVDLTPRVVTAIGKILNLIIGIVQKSAVPLAIAIGTLVDAILMVLVQNTPKIVAAGAKIILALLSGLASNITPITTHVATIITRFLTALAAKAPDLVTAGANMLGAFLTGIGNRAAGLAAKAANIVIRFVAGIASKIPELLAIGSKLIANLVEGIGQHVGRMVTAGVNAIIHFLTGLGNAAGRLIRKGIEIAGKFIHGVATGLVRLADVGAQAIIDFLNGMAEVIRTRGKEIRDAGWNLADAIMDGMVDGLKEAYNRLPGPVKGMIHVVTKTAKFALKSKSPSKVFHEIGGFIVQGLANGISESSIAEKSMANTADNVIQAGQKMRNVSGLLDGVMDVDPTITPILDLSQVKKEAGTLGDITKVPPIKATGSIGQALSISSEKARIDNDSLAAVAAGVSDKPAVHYEQTINSPEPLSTAEIYRRTNNTLSKIRKDVGLQ